MNLSRPDGSSYSKSAIIDASETKDCREIQDKVDGQWGSWSPWSSCTQGSMSRTRECDSPAPATEGETCPGDRSQTQGCNLNPSSTTKEALIISGGASNDHKARTDNSVEVFVPSTAQHCQLPNIPGYHRTWHTMEGMTLCGGERTTLGDSTLTCHTMTDGGWEISSNLTTPRLLHSSWVSPSGLTILMGGIFSERTTEKIQEDGSSRLDFSLEYATLAACAINNGATVLITGGRTGKGVGGRGAVKIVAEYSEDGYQRDLPQLGVARSLHGCTYFVNDKGTKTYLVTGGESGFDILSSTELLEETAKEWVLGAELPAPCHGLSVATVDSRVLSTGGTLGSPAKMKDIEEILEFDPRTGWTVLSNMSVGRYYHAVSTVPFTNVEKFCKL